MSRARCAETVSNDPGCWNNTRQASANKTAIRIFCPGEESNISIKRVIVQLSFLRFKPARVDDNTFAIRCGQIQQEAGIER